MDGLTKEFSLVQAQTFDRSARHERAKAARRELILEAARRAFAARGLRGTTIADIAEEAEIALGTIYLYFPSKEAVFAALSLHLNELIATAVFTTPLAVSLEDTVRRRVEAVFSVCEQNRDLIRLVVLNTDPESDVTLALRRSFHDRLQPIADQAAEAMARGDVRAGDASIMTRLVIGLISIAVYQAFVLCDGEESTQYAAECVEMICAYLRPRPETRAAGGA
jgi:AcrR family transcriptional regulator